MQFTIALASTILAFASGISALPAGPNPVTLTIFNDQSGRSGIATVPADGQPRPVTVLFGKTPIDINGNLIGTSAQLTGFSDTSKCTLQRDGWVIELDGRAKNFVDLDGNPNVAIPIWLNGFTFQCSSA